MSTICWNWFNSEVENPSPHWIKSSKELINAGQVVEEGLSANATAASSYCYKSASCPGQASVLLLSSLLQEKIVIAKNKQSKFFIIKLVSLNIGFILKVMDYRTL